MGAACRHFALAEVDQPTLHLVACPDCGQNFTREALYSAQRADPRAHSPAEGEPVEPDAPRPAGNVPIQPSRPRLWLVPNPDDRTDPDRDRLPREHGPFAPDAG